MTCSDCVYGFFLDPVKLAIVLFSLGIALFGLMMMLKKNLSSGKRVFFVYVHVFGIIFPIALYLFYSGCQALFSGCNQLMATIYLFGLTALISAIIGSFAAPIVFIIIKRKASIALDNALLETFVKSESAYLSMKPPVVRVIDSGKPVAFSFSNIRPVIFVSAGMLDLLSRKEAEAVLLHELKHVKSGTSLLKFSSFFARLFAPLSGFSLSHELNSEERVADEHAVSRQGTARFIRSAKQKINSFFECQE